MGSANKCICSLNHTNAFLRDVYRGFFFLGSGAVFFTFIGEALTGEGGAMDDWLSDAADAGTGTEACVCCE